MTKSAAIRMLTETWERLDCQMIQNGWEIYEGHFELDDEADG
jgi:hypothetical protein